MINKIIIKTVSVFLLVSGISAGALFFNLGLRTVKDGESAATVTLCFGLALLSFVLGGFGAMLINYGKNTYLRIENGRIKACYGMGTTVDLPLEEVEDVYAYGNVLTLFGKRGAYRISLYEEYAETVTELLAYSKDPKSVNADKENRGYARASVRRMFFAWASLIMGAVIILNMILCVGLTDGKDITDFTPRDDNIWLACFAAQVASALAFFFFAHMGRKATLEREKHLHRLGSALGYENRYGDTDVGGTVLRVIFVDNYRARVILSENLGVFIYSLYVMDPGSGKWIVVETQTCESREELDELFESRLGNLAVCEEKLFG